MCERWGGVLGRAVEAWQMAFPCLGVVWGHLREYGAYWLGEGVYGHALGEGHQVTLSPPRE